MTSVEVSQSTIAPAARGALGVVFERVEKCYASGRLALSGIDLSVAPGEFVSLLGPSGCGKSTLLRIAAGLELASAGRVQGAGRGNSERGDVAFVFQEAALMPWASVFDNVWLPLRLAGLTRPQAHDAVMASLTSVGLADVAAALPHTLSGGMKMRVSVARALVTRPRLLLMDEPFGALDEITRTRLNADLLSCWAQWGFTVLFVTHSVYEAAYLSQRVVVMGATPGRILHQERIRQTMPREAGFRTSVDYAQTCSRLSAALESASGALA